MGMALFESSGTFVPSDYGLTTGDTIQIVAVGGRWWRRRHSWNKQLS